MFLSFIWYPLQRKSHLCIPRKGIARPQSQFPHSCVCEQFIYSQDQSTIYIFSCRVGRPILGMFKSFIDTWMFNWKLGLRLRYSFSGNICFKFSVLRLCSVRQKHFQNERDEWFWQALKFAAFSFLRTRFGNENIHRGFRGTLCFEIPSIALVSLIEYFLQALQNLICTDSVIISLSASWNCPFNNQMGQGDKGEKDGKLHI
jgi:hypothetical protein